MVFSKSFGHLTGIKRSVNNVNLGPFKTTAKLVNPMRLEPGQSAKIPQQTVENSKYICCFQVRSLSRRHQTCVHKKKKIYIYIYTYVCPIPLMIFDQPCFLWVFGLQNLCSVFSSNSLHHENAPCIVEPCVRQMH